MSLYFSKIHFNHNCPCPSKEPTGDPTRVYPLSINSTTTLSHSICTYHTPCRSSAEPSHKPCSTIRAYYTGSTVARSSATALRCTLHKYILATSSPLLPSIPPRWHIVIGTRYYWSWRRMPDDHLDSWSSWRT